MKLFSFFFIAHLLISCSSAQEKLPDKLSCEWCGANEAPKDITSNTTIAEISEKGQRIKISGTVYLADGETPAGNVILYLYHTNAEGVYPKKGNETGNGQRHGYLRSWVRTGDDGIYSFETIKPEPYPGRNVPAHIHITVKELKKKEYWLKDYFFEGDKLLSAKDRKNESGNDRFNHVVKLTRQGPILIGERNILLKD
ncbi:MAG: intradiol ring-cleavage dioxygenase [Ekhidna sp.]